MAELTESEWLHVWLFRELLKHNERDEKLQGNAWELGRWLRAEGKAEPEHANG
jgi:hypothetical protein